MRLSSQAHGHPMKISQVNEMNTFLLGVCLALLCFGGDPIAFSSAHLELMDEPAASVCVEAGCSLWVPHRQEFVFSGQPRPDGPFKPGGSAADSDFLVQQMVPPAARARPGKRRRSPCVEENKRQHR